MKTTADVLDAIAAEERKRGGTGSDYAVARILGVNTARLSNLRHGRQTLSKSLCKVAGMYLGIEPAALVNLAAAEREEDPELKAGFLRMASGYLPALATVAVGMLAHPIARAADCILC
ncbi:MAG: hypothetical protein K2Y51_06375 [Gammaproteobacteria bacterium]|nr:hypothetical protein [Gammaproteobacteria bacterium]